MKYVFFSMFVFLFLFTGNTKAQEEGVNQQSIERKRKVVSLLEKKRNSKRATHYKFDQFKGKWQEISRINNITKESIIIKDTIYLNFYGTNKVEVKEGTSPILTGYSAVEPGDYLTTSVNDYKIISVSDKEIVLADLEESTYTFEKKSSFYYETAPAPVIRTVGDTAQAVINLTNANLIKNWFAYKRNAKPGEITSETPLIRGLIVSGKINESSYKGEISYAKSGKEISLPCTVSVTGLYLNIAAEGMNWNLEVQKADGKELVLGKKGELVYYFKPQ